MIQQICSYEVKDSKTNLKIPVVNGVHLHSVYDPINEAKLFAEKNEKIIYSKKNMLHNFFQD